MATKRRQPARQRNARDGRTGRHPLLHDTAGNSGSRNLAVLGTFCRRMGREARQGEVGLVVGDEYFAIQDFEED
jgi:hypothetical protein